MSRCVLVLGIIRSGSSVTAGILERLGVFVGDDLVAPDPANPRGYWEDWDIVHILQRITDGRNKISRADWDAIADPMRTTIQTREREHDIWGFKSGLLCLCAHHLWPMLDDCRMVICERDYQASLVSECCRPIWAGGRGQPLQQVMEQQQLLLAERLRRQAEFTGPRLTVEYDQTVEQPEVQVDRLAEFAFEGLASPSLEQRARAVALVDPRLRHW